MVMVSWKQLEIYTYLFPMKPIWYGMAFPYLCSLDDMKITVSWKACIKIVTRAIYTCLFFYLCRHSTFLFCWKIKSWCDSCFPQQIRLQTTVQWCILQDCSSERIDFNMIDKCHKLPRVYTMLKSVKSQSFIIVLLRVKRSMWQSCLNIKISKFTLQLNQFY